MMVRIAPRLMFAAQPRDVVTAIERRSRMRRLAAGFGEQPFVVIDAGASVDAINGALLAGASRLVAVTSIDRLGIAATYALIKLIGAQFPALPVSVLVNRADPADATNAFGQIATGVEQFLGCNTVFAGSIPEDATIAAAMEAGLSPTETTGSAAQAAELLANLLMITGAGRPGRPLIARIS
jgi:MinD-like ATPase involved in chromosome partitioning or flagellar assembly